MSRTSEKKDERIYLRLPTGLKEQIQTYARAKNTTVSELTIRFYTQLLEEEERRQAVDAEQV